MTKGVFWKNPGYKPGLPLKGAIVADYLIVGGGIAGVSSAYFLIKKGVKPQNIAIIELGVVGEGSTGHSAGMLIPEPENDQSLWWGPIIEKYGKGLAQAYRSAHLNALKVVEGLIGSRAVACQALMGDLLILARDDDSQKLFIEEDRIARALLGERPRSLKKVRLGRELKSPLYTALIRTKKGISVNPLMLVQNFAAHLRREGVAVYEHTPLVSVRGAKAQTAHGSVTFKRVIYARGMGEPHAGLRRYITTIGITRPLSERALASMGLEDRDMFIDEKPGSYCYYGKVTADRRLLIGYGDVATRNVSSGTTLHASHKRSLVRHLKAAFPTVSLPLQYAWSGGYTVAAGMTPVVKAVKNGVLINGAGNQLGSMVAAEYAVSKLLKKSHPLSRMWE